MAVREKVALLISLTVVLAATQFSDGLPTSSGRRKSVGLRHYNPTPTLQSSAKAKDNSRKRTFKPNNNDQDQANACKKFKFPEIEYPIASFQNKALCFHNLANDHSKDYQNVMYKEKSIPKNIEVYKLNKNQKLRAKQLVPKNMKGTEFSSMPNYRDVGMFPEVEYPLDANDVWRPSYWNCPPKTFNPANCTSQTASRRGVQRTRNAVVKPKSIHKRKKNNQAAQNKSLPPRSRKTNSINKEEKIQLDLPTKKRTHEIIPLKTQDNSNSVDIATPKPHLLQKDDIKTALQSKLVASIKKKTTAKANHLDSLNFKDLEKTLSGPRQNLCNDNIKDQNVNRPPISGGLYSTTEPRRNLFTAHTDRPELSCESDVTESTHSLPHTADNILLPDSPGLPPRGVYNISDTVGQHIHKDTETKTTDNASDSSDEEFTTDDPLIETAPVLSTASPVDTSWRNVEVLDPYKSFSYPDELEEYYLAVQ